MTKQRQTNKCTFAVDFHQTCVEFSQIIPNCIHALCVYTLYHSEWWRSKLKKKAYFYVSVNRQNRKLKYETSYKYSDTVVYIVRYVLHVIFVYFTHTHTRARDSYGCGCCHTFFTLTSTLMIIVTIATCYYTTVISHCYYRSTFINSGAESNRKLYDEPTLRKRWE